MSYSLDVNVLLHAAHAGSPKNRRAVAFLRDCATRSEVLCLAWTTVMGFVRITTHPGVLAAPLTHDEAVQHVDALLSLPQTRLLTEGEGFWQVYEQATRDLPVRGKLVPDAHLAALLRQHGVDRLYTSDTDFRKFRFLDVRDPFAGS